jgi:hypothetical protein
LCQMAPPFLWGYVIAVSLGLAGGFAVPIDVALLYAYLHFRAHRGEQVA